MTHAPPLPFQPNFNVYGIRDVKEDQRWLALWNQAAGTGRGPLAQVSVGYGPRESARLIVVTDAKLVDHDRTDAEPWSYRATGLKDAAISALLYIVNFTGSRRTESLGGSTKEIADRLDELSSHIYEPLWTEDHIHIDGRLTRCHVHTIGSMWVAAVDLGSVAISLAGLDADLKELNVTPINDQLESYT
jgi:hypothetical protein